MLAAAQRHPVPGFGAATAPLNSQLAATGTPVPQSPRVYGFSASKAAETIEAEAEGKALVKPRWERLPSGSKLQVWWAGSDEYFTCKILDWKVSHGPARELIYTHRCQ